MVQISLQNSGRKVVFYAWVPRNPPWAPTGVKVPWYRLSYPNDLIGLNILNLIAIHVH